LLLFSVVSVGGAAEYATAVETLEVSETTDAVEVTITATDAAEYTYFELDSPRRVVVDFHNSENRIGTRNTAVGVAGVRGVRVASYTDKSRDVTRVVFDLEDATPYRVVESVNGRLHVRFGPETAFAAPEPPDTVTGSVAVAAEARTGGTDADSGRVAEVHQPVELALESAPVLASSQEATPAAWNVGARPEAGVNAPIESAVAARPAVESAILSDGRVEEFPLVASTAPTPLPAASPAQFAGLAAAQASTPAVRIPALQNNAGAAPPPPEPPALARAAAGQVAPQATQYTGEVVTFNVVGADLVDFFRVINELSGLNIIVDDDVNGSLNMTLNEVPWDQALDLVLRTNNLGYELEGNILRIATQATLAAEEAQRQQARDAQALNVPLETRPFILSYTNVANVLPIIDPLLSDRGTMIPDARRNALIITDVPAQFAQYESMIEFLDTPSQQVEIEARLLSVTKTFSREFGSQLALLLQNNQNPAGNGATFNTTLAGPASSSIGFLIGAGGDVVLDQVISMAEANGTGKLLSRPRVITQNNIPASIQQGTQIPVQTNVNNTVSVEFIPFTLSLEVTPQITDAGTILLTATITNSTPDFGRAVGGIPSVATQTANTQVLIPDGGTAVVGGILTDSDSLNTSQVPGLGSIPVLGHLFKSTSIVKDTAELLFFITARIKPSDPLEFLSDSLEEESELLGALQ
jgi:type IV pilus assembly protein PilQ